MCFLLNYNLIKSKGCNALHLAARNNHSSVVKLLIEKGVLLNQSYIGNTSFHEAAMNGSLQTLQTIYNIEPNFIDLANREQVNNNLNEYFFFIFNLIFIIKDTALHLASSRGHTSVVNYLLDKNAAFTFNENGMSFFDLAIKYKQNEIIMAIISHERFYLFLKKL